VALGSNPQTPSAVVGVAVLEGNEDNCFNALIDAQNGYAYYGTDYPAHLVKVALGASNTPPYRVGSVLIDETGILAEGCWILRMAMDVSKWVPAWSKSGWARVMRHR